VLKGSLHYDSERGVGLLVNVTGRNFLGKASRSLISVDIAEEPSFRLQHQKYFGHDKRWWWRSEIFEQELNQKVYIKGQKADDLRYRFFQFNNQFNRNLNSLKSYMGVGINYEYTRVKPEVDPEINDNVLSLEKYYFHNMMLNFQYVYDNLNQAFYPTQGTYFQAKVNRSFIHQVDIEFTQDTIPDNEGETDGFTRLSLDFKKRIYVNNKISGIIHATTGFTFVDGIQAGELSFLDYGYGANYFIGGNLERPRVDDYMFRGLREAELIVSQFMILNLGVQFNPIKSIYITPHLNLASIGYGNFTDYMKDAFSPSGNWSEETETSGVFSVGVTSSYNSILGPLDLDISWVNDINKIRLFLGIGFQFNRSN
jgi:NTE family protein